MSRPMWPPGAEIAAQAFDAYAAWEHKWSEDLEGFDDPYERASAYSHMRGGIDIDLAKDMARAETKIIAAVKLVTRS